MDNSFQGLPKFKSPEEELAYLREHIARRENEMATEGNIVNKEKLTHETIDEYAEVPKARVLHSAVAMKDKEVKGIALRLEPETHDAKMEELLAVLLSKGLRNALHLLEEINNPHLDDDFHRFLVEYIHSQHKVPDLKEKSPVWKALHMRLFEVTLPPEKEGEGKKGFKEFIGAMEQFYSGMLSIRSDKNNHERNFYTLEIALSHASDSVVIYAGIPEERVDLFEKQVLAFYENAKVREVVDDYNIFNESGYSTGAYLIQDKKPVFPIQLAEKIDHDPMNTILNAFSKLKKIGEGAAIQFIIAPVGEHHLQNFNHILKDAKEGEKIHMGNRALREFDKDFKKVTKQLFFGHQKVEKDKDRDYWMSADEAKKYGIVDHILKPKTK